jgi:cellulose biosynthesis protein BcsQ
MGKIYAFWSNVHGQSRTTSNMVAMAVVTALTENYSCLLMQTHFNLNNLESYLIGSRENSRDVFMDVGIDGLARSIKLEPLNKETIENYSIPLLNNRLTLLPGTTNGNRAIYHDEMAKTLNIIMKEADKYYDFIFIDINSGSDEISKMVLSQADLVVVNLCQNKSVLDNFFSAWQMKDRKIMYLIGSYDKNSSYNIHNLKNLYKPFRKTAVAEIPYNTGFMDAQSDGNVIRFMNRNMAIKKMGENAYFMECVKKASEKLLKITEYKRGGVTSGI